ncbi:endothelin-converting enzyme 1-like [Dermacentor andersoni]|uniref:endothelin-converting enzyme 1-like n=1 Tax=Dermacentor andersoni TaxID=34620 RepID=UPI0024174AFA|nr:neprilysin-1-like [Dermacentor andersoni]
MAKSSSREEPLIDLMQNFSLQSVTALIAFQTMISRVAKSEGKSRNDTMLAVKNPAQVEIVKSLLSSKAESLFHYMGLHLTVYVSPFLEDGQSFVEASSFLLSGRTGSPPKWRLCVRLVDRILPTLLIVSFEQYMNRSDTFSELMAYIMAEELRSAFIDEFSHIERFDNWTKYIVSEQLEQVRMLFLFPARFSANSLLPDLVNKIETEVPAMNQSLQYFLKLSALVASKWADRSWNFVPNSRRLSLFNTDCYYDPGWRAVVLPLSLFNISIPTSAKEGMFHIPRVGPRLSNCLFDAIFGTSALNSLSISQTETTSKHFETTSRCLEQHYNSSKKEAMTTASRIEENSALVVAYEAYEDRLFTKQYLNRDYGFANLENVNSEQLFFAYYALNYCTSRNSPNQTKWMIMRDRVNVPLKNSYEFATAFGCAQGTPMNPSNKCSFWD